MDVLIWDMAVIKRCYLDKINKEDLAATPEFGKSKGKSQIKLTWKDLPDCQTLRLFAHVAVKIEKSEKLNDFNVIIQKPK